MKIPQDERRQMADRLHTCEGKIAELSGEVERCTIAMDGLIDALPESVDDAIPAETLALIPEKLPIATRRAVAAQELAEQVQEAGALRVELMASENPLRVGGLLGRSSKVKLLRAQAERDTNSASLHAMWMQSEAAMLEVAMARHGSVGQ